MNSSHFTVCPYCGEKIQKNAPSCPHCGSDESTGWSENTYLDGIDLGDDFDYNLKKHEEFTNAKKKIFITWKSGIALVIVLLFLLFYITFIV